MIVQQTTKELLAESLKELSKFKAVDKITIKELTKNCGLTSPTFYNHFRDKYDLMAWIYNQRVEASMKNFAISRGEHSHLPKHQSLTSSETARIKNFRQKQIVGGNSSMPCRAFIHSPSKLIAWSFVVYRKEFCPTAFLSRFT